MVSRLTWVRTSGQGSTNSNQAITPVMSVTVPAGATLKRVVTHWAIQGTQFSQNSNVFTVGALEVQEDIQINNAVYVNRTIQTRRAMMRTTSLSWLETGMIPPRFFVLDQTLDDIALGINHECSYNGPGKPALTVTMACASSRMQALQVIFTLVWDRSLAALYYL